MRQLMDAEVLSLAKLLEMEINGLAVAKTSRLAVSDEQLQRMYETGITAAEARIAGLQQFINENQLAGYQETNIQ
ncbi:hypothetical protein [Dendrosporobacter sp. 1207_IL3150]|uniref:hypothetical protein n=1 Tax=Dendrosporobacter sp. 1207_IL3150 TaxID=3084054 RepID=UPI002FD9E27D